MDVIFQEGEKMPVGETASMFSSEIGILTRQFASPEAGSWSKVTDDEKALPQQRLSEKFNLDLDALKTLVDKLFKESQKRFRGMLSRHYKKFTPEEAPRHPHKAVKQEEWEEICKRFSSPEFKRRSLINSQNRAKLVINHVGGSRSFVQHRFKKKTEMVEMQSQPGNEWTEDEIADRVLGITAGYKRGLGHGVKGTSIRVQSSQAELDATKQKLADSEQQVNILTEKQDEMNEKQLRMEVEMKEKQAKMEADLLDNRARLEALMAAFNSPPSAGVP